MLRAGPIRLACAASRVAAERAGFSQAWCSSLAGAGASEVGFALFVVVSGPAFSTPSPCENKGGALHVSARGAPPTIPDPFSIPPPPPHPPTHPLTPISRMTSNSSNSNKTRRRRQSASQQQPRGRGAACTRAPSRRPLQQQPQQPLPRAAPPPLRAPEKRSASASASTCASKRRSCLKRRGGGSRRATRISCAARACPANVCSSKAPPLQEKGPTPLPSATRVLLRV